jgi:hypothetical protein
MSDDVGYKKPPRHTQFQKGRSGNPSGRPKGTSNYSTILAHLLDRQVPVTIKGKKAMMTMRDAVAVEAVKHAIDGSMRHIELLLSVAESAEYRPLVIVFGKGDEKI